MVHAALGGVTTLAISQAEYMKLGFGRFIRKQSTTVKDRHQFQETGVELTCKHTVLHNYVRTPHDKAMIMQAVANNKVLGEVMSLTNDQIAMVVDVVQLVEVPRGECVIRKGEWGTAFFIVQEGDLEIQVGGHIPDLHVRRGDSFGELALLYNMPRKATVEALMDSQVWVMAQSDLRAITQAANKMQLQEYATLLRSVSLLVENINESLFESLASVVEEVRLSKGDLLSARGSDVGCLFIIYDGEGVRLPETNEDGEEVVPEQIMHRGDYVGDAELVSNTAAKHSVQILTTTARALLLDHTSFSAVLDASRNVDKSAQPPAELFKRHVNRVLNQIRVLHVFGANVPDRQENMIMHRCDIAGCLGEGSFGFVFLLRERTTQKEFALKVVSKQRLKEEQQEQMLQNERRLHADVSSSSFVVRLHGCFEDSNFMCLLLDCAMGGELFDVYSDGNLWGSVPHAKFYCASVALGLSHLHEKRIVWRDLKLENCLIDAKGYIKLTDFGIAKQIIGKTYTVCGTTDYFAPETLRRSGHNRGADWWACGVLLFIMLAGRSPFDAPSVQQIYKNIIRGISKVRFPTSCPPAAKKTVLSLCQRNPEDRLPMQKGGIANLMQSAFFKDISADDLIEQKIEAPFIPPPPNYEKIASKKPSRTIDLDLSILRAMQDGFIDNLAPKPGRTSIVELPPGRSLWTSVTTSGPEPQ